MDNNVNYAINKMEKIIRSWGWSQEEYREKLARLTPMLLFMACAFAIENFIYELEFEAELQDQKRVSELCASVREQRQKIVELGLHGRFEGENIFESPNLDTARFDQSDNLCIYLNNVFEHNSEGADPNTIVIPCGVVLRLDRTPFVSDQDQQVLELAKCKSEVARSLGFDPRTYWPESESRRRD